MKTTLKTIPMASTTDDEIISQFINKAVEAKEKAYCPYSKFRVGAAVLCENGAIFSGCNVENCSSGNTICAERTALVKAVSEGYQKFKAIAITSDLKSDIRPCGLCRQFMIEFGNDWDVYMTCSDLTYKKVKVSELLPMAFEPSHLQSKT